MSDNGKNPRKGTAKRVKLPDGTWGIYMGQTGRIRKASPAFDEKLRAEQNPASPGKAREGNHPRPKLSLSEEERREAEARKNEIRAKRAAANAGIHKRLPERAPEEKKFYHKIIDRVHMWHLGLAVNIDTIIKGAVCALLITVFAMLQVTVFSRIRPFGATPDLMLPLVIAIGVCEGERWGGVAGLAAAFLIDCLGSTGITLLPLLYVPCGFAAGVLGTYYLRDSFTIRVLFTAASCVLRAIFTVICVFITYSSVDVGLMFKQIVLPEFVSTFLFSLLPHIAVWLSMKPFHKTRAERVD